MLGMQINKSSLWEMAEALQQLRIFAVTLIRVVAMVLINVLSLFA